jgi:membrane fusion protein, heavy metal efflux system
MTPPTMETPPVTTMQRDHSPDRRCARRSPVHPAAMALLLSALAGACSGRSAPAKSETPEASAKGVSAADDMKDMPGMAPRTTGGDAGDQDARGPGPEEKSGETSEAAGTAAAGSASEVTFTAAQVQHGKVRWAPVTMGAAAGTATVPGQVVPNEDRTARLGAAAGGRVVAVRVSPGDRVRRGQVLVTLQSPEAGMAQSELAKATAAVSSARAQVAYAQSARDRAERLLALKAIPRQDVERAVADAALARATLAQAEAELRRARTTAGQLGAGAAASGEIAIRAPLSGVVLARTAVPGTVVGTGAPLVVVTDPASLWLTINAPEALAGLFHRGGQLHFTVPAYPADTFTARVEAVGAGLDPDTRTLPVRAAVVGTTTLKPEMLATVRVTGAGTVPAVMLADDAVQLVGGRPTVFLAHPDGKGGARFTPRPVEVGPRGGGTVAVTRGLAAGDVVVTAGAFAVKAQLQTGNMPEMEM